MVAPFRNHPVLRLIISFTGISNSIVVRTIAAGELACGNLRNRAILAHRKPPPTTLATHDEALAMIAQQHLTARGVAFIAVQLLASAKRSNATRWTRDVAVAAIAAEFGIAAAASGLH